MLWTLAGAFAGFSLLVSLASAVCAVLNVAEEVTPENFQKVLKTQLHPLESSPQQLFQLRSDTAPLPGVFGTGVTPYDFEGVHAVSLNQDYVQLSC